MSLSALAKHLTDAGRHGDTTLVHMNPKEVAGLQALAERHGKSLTINPHTGLPEAFSIGGFDVGKALSEPLGDSGLSRAVGTIAPIAAGAMLGPGGYGLMSAAQAGMTVGGLYALGTGDLQKGLMAGMGAYGGAGMGGSSSASAPALEQQAAAENVAAKAAEQQATNETINQAITQSAKPGLESLPTAQLAESIPEVAPALDQSAAETARLLNAEAGATPSGIEQLIAKAKGAYDKMTPGQLTALGVAGAGPLMSALSPKQEMPNEDGTFTKTAAIRPKYAYRDANGNIKIVDLPSVMAKDWDSKQGINDYVRSKVAEPKYAADGGLMSLTSGSNSQLAYDNDPVVRMASGGIAYLADGGDSTDAAAAAEPTYSGGVTQDAVNSYFEEHPGVSYEQAVNAGTNAGLSAADIANAWASHTGGTSSGSSNYVNYTPEQIGSYLQSNAGKSTDLSEAIKQYNADPNQVYGFVQNLVGPYNMPTYTQGGTGAYGIAQNLGQYGITSNELFDAFKNANPNIAQSGQYMGNLSNLSRVEGISDRLSNFVGDGFLPRSDYDWSRWADQERLTPKDISIQTGLSEQEVRDRYVPVKTTLPTGSGGGGNDGTGGGTGDGTDGSPTKPTTYAPDGTTNPYGNEFNPGDITFNPDGSRTITPNIPGRPYGGFTGMNQVRNAYTSRGGSLGQTLAPTREYGNSGQSQNVYQYLMGQATSMPRFTQTNPTADNTFKNLASPSDAEKLANATKFKVWQDGTLIDNPYYGWAPLATNAGLPANTLSESAPGWASGGSAQAYAMGGQTHYNLGGYSDGGRLLRGPGDGVSDSIPATIGDKQPARLADGEFVVPARIVSELGNGSTDAGARKLYQMMHRVQNARKKTTGKNRIAEDTDADKYLPQ